MSKSKSIKVYTKKIYSYTFVASLLLLCSSCANLDIKVIQPDTVKTDLHHDEFSRSQYYEKLANNYFEQKQYLPATEYFRLALLHDDKNLSARFGLAQTYVANKQDQLALLEFEKYVADSESKKISEDHLKIITSFYNELGAFKLVYELNQKYFIETKSNTSLWNMYSASLRLKNYENAFNALSLLSNNGSTKNKPEAYLIHLSKAEIYSLQKNDEQAVSELDLAEIEKPFDELLLKKKMQVYSQLEKWSDVVLTGKKYIKYQKHTLTVSDLIIEAALKSEDYQTAADQIIWQASHVQDKEIYDLKLAHLNYLQKKYIEAEAQYQKLLDINKYANEVKYYLSLIYLHRNNHEAGYEMLSEIEPDSDYYAEAQIQLAINEHQNDEKEAAILRLAEASEVKTQSVMLYKVHSDYLIEKEKYMESVIALSNGIDKTKNNEDLYFNLAFSYYKLKNFEDYKKAFDMGLLINPKSAKAYEVMTELWYADQKSSTEIAYFAETALDFGSKNENISKILAWAYADLNQMNKAVALFEKLYDKNPHITFYSEMLSKIYNAKNVNNKAINFGIYAQKTNEYVDPADNINKMLRIQNVKDQQRLYNNNRLPASLD